MKQISPDKLLASIRNKLKHYSSAWTPKSYLQVDEDLVNVLGRPDYGIPYGCLIELSGAEQSGKSALALSLLAQAQADGAYGIWLDAENSLDEQWATRRGVDWDKLYKIRPYVGVFGTKDGKKRRLTSAQELCSEFEQVIERVTTLCEKHGTDFKFFGVVDSLTALLTADELNAGLEGQNMRTQLSLPAYLGKLLRRWVGMCQSYNATILFVNQLRVDPTQRFGNPEYEPGGKATKFYCHIRARMKRGKGGGVMQNSSKQIGIKGTIRNVKNKTGGVEKIACGYKIFWKGHVKFVTAEALDKGE